MKEAIGNSLILGLVITFIIIFIIFFAGSTSYTKAFKVKNKIVEILEKHNDILNDPSTNNGALKQSVEDEINAVLGEIGYRISPVPNQCPERNGQSAIHKNQTANYEYCIYQYDTIKGTYFGVTAYVYYQIPLLGTELRFPVYGETKINGILGNGIIRG